MRQRVPILTIVNEKVGSVVQKLHLALSMLAFRPALKEVAMDDAVLERSLSCDFQRYGAL